MIDNFKRIVLLSGHYGSGKTNIAVNLALFLKQTRERLAIADIDIVNPYFRTLDSKKELEASGIELIVSAYAGTNVDLPALPQEINAITEDRSMSAIVDVGGDDRGALALGRWQSAIADENNYEMLLVVNRYRPLTRDAASTIEVMREIENAAGLRFTAIVNNSNLGEETSAADVLFSVPYANEITEKTALPLRFTSVSKSLYPELLGKIDNLFPLELQRKIK